MNIKECENRNVKVMLNAIKWAKGEDCESISLIELMIVVEYLNMGLPKCFHHFIKTDKNDRCTASGAFKTIFKTLDKIKVKLLEYDENKLYE